ncbi:MAG: hypothetical protein FJY54_08590 [Betaproteobacteria bacterium]|nr:hypothetical protein [Betaproteobacteria bacterium]
MGRLARASLRLLGAAAATLALCGAMPQGAGEGGKTLVTFAALGDTPYTREEEARFPDLIAELNREELAFVVHVGDFKSALSACTDELFLERRAWFGLSHHAFVYVPGDNEWTDCARPVGAAYDPLERLRKLRELFFAGSASLGQRPIALERQSAVSRRIHDYPEHARWEHRGVVFVTLNAPGPTNNVRAQAEHSQRSAAIRNWLTGSFRLARERQARAVVVVMHANPWGRSGEPRRGFPELLERLAAEVRGFGGEVLLVHGDTHRYRVDQPLRDPATGAAPPNFSRVEVFGSPEMNWVRVRVSEEDGRVRFEVTPGS